MISKFSKAYATSPILTYTIVCHSLLALLPLKALIFMSLKFSLIIMTMFLKLLQCDVFYMNKQILNIFKRTVLQFIYLHSTVQFLFSFAPFADSNLRENINHQFF